MWDYESLLLMQIQLEYITIHSEIWQCTQIKRVQTMWQLLQQPYILILEVVVTWQFDNQPYTIMLLVIIIRQYDCDHFNQIFQDPIILLLDTIQHLESLQE